MGSQTVTQLQAMSLDLMAGPGPHIHGHQIGSGFGVVESELKLDVLNRRTGFAAPARR